ncbi:MAG: hypothetical protein ABSD59_10805 [Terracidiphilus sp.]
MLPELGRIRPWQDFDSQLVLGVVQVILRKPLAHFRYGAADSVVCRRVVVRWAIKDLDTDGPFLETIAEAI